MPLPLTVDFLTDPAMRRQPSALSSSGATNEAPAQLDAAGGAPDGMNIRAQQRQVSVVHQGLECTSGARSESTGTARVHKAAKKKKVWYAWDDICSHCKEHGVDSEDDDGHDHGPMDPSNKYIHACEHTCPLCNPCVDFCEVSRADIGQPSVAAMPGKARDAPQGYVLGTSCLVAPYGVQHQLPAPVEKACAKPEAYRLPVHFKKPPPPCPPVRVRAKPPPLQVPAKPKVAPANQAVAGATRSVGWWDIHDEGGCPICHPPMCGGRVGSTGGSPPQQKVAPPELQRQLRCEAMEAPPQPKVPKVALLLQPGTKKAPPVAPIEASHLEEARRLLQAEGRRLTDARILAEAKNAAPPRKKPPPTPPPMKKQPPPFHPKWWPPPTGGAQSSQEAYLSREQQQPQQYPKQPVLDWQRRGAAGPQQLDDSSSSWTGSTPGSSWTGSTLSLS